MCGSCCGALFARHMKIIYSGSSLRESAARYLKEQIVFLKKKYDISEIDESFIKVWTVTFTAIEPPQMRLQSPVRPARMKKGNKKLCVTFACRFLLLSGPKYVLLNSALMLGEK